MSLQEFLEKSSSNERNLTSKILNIFRHLLDFIIDFKSALIIIIAWLLISEVANYINPEEYYTLSELLRSIFMILLYPISLLFFNTGFDEIDVNQIFILFVPLVILVTVGFLIIISTED